MIREARVAAAVEHRFMETEVVMQAASLFREHHERVLRAAYRITGSMADAEDVAQTVFARVIQPGSSQDSIANPKSYLYRAAINAALDLVRQRKRENSVSLELVDEEADAARSSNLESSEIRDSLRRALAELDSRAAGMFAMRYLEDCDYREIAIAFNTSRAVVAVTLHRTRTRLQKLLTNARGKS